jgi:hypothetical protein
MLPLRMAAVESWHSTEARNKPATARPMRRRCFCRVGTGAARASSLIRKRRKLWQQPPRPLCQQPIHTAPKPHSAIIATQHRARAFSTPQSTIRIATPQHFQAGMRIA